MIKSEEVKVHRRTSYCSVTVMKVLFTWFKGEKVLIKRVDASFSRLNLTSCSDTRPLRCAALWESIVCSSGGEKYEETSDSLTTRRPISAPSRGRGKSCVLKDQTTLVLSGR